MLMFFPCDTYRMNIISKNSSLPFINYIMSRPFMACLFWENSSPMLWLPINDKSYVYNYLLYCICQCYPYFIIIIFSSNCIQVYNALKRAAHSKVYKRTDMPERYHYKGHRRAAPIIVIADVGWTLGSVGTRAVWYQHRNRNYVILVTFSSLTASRNVIFTICCWARDKQTSSYWHTCFSEDTVLTA